MKRNSPFVAILILVSFGIVGCRTTAPELYPLCNLRCVPGGACGIEQGVSVEDVRKLAENLSDSYFASIKYVTVTPGYALLIADKTTHAKLRSNWGPAACFTTVKPSDDLMYARLQQCLQGMPSWIKFSLPSDAGTLMIDDDFRKVCMGAVY